MVGKYTKQVLEFLGSSSREDKDAEWERITGLGLPEVDALTFVEDALSDISYRESTARLNFIDAEYCSAYNSNDKLDLAA